MKIAMVSEHASPLAALGGADAGGQNVHVAELALGLARLGHEVRRLHAARRPRPARAGAARPRRPRRARAGGPAAHAAQGRPAAVHGRLRRLDGRPTGRAPATRTSCTRHFWMSGLAAAARRPRRAACPWRRPSTRWAASSAATRATPTPARPSASSSSAGSPPRSTPSSPPAATRCDELARMGVPTDHVRVVPCGVDTAHFTPRAAPSRTALPRAGGAAAARGGAAGRAQGLRPRGARPRRPARTPSSSSSAARRRSSWTTTPRPGGCGPSRPSSASRTGSCSPASGRTRRCRRSTARRTSCSPCRGTSRSASRRSRRRPAAARSWAPRSAGCWTPSTTASPACLVPPRDVPALAAAVRDLLDDPDEAARMGRARARPGGRALRLVGRGRAHRGGARRHRCAAPAPAAPSRPPGSTSTLARSRAGCGSLRAAGRR